MRGRAGVVVIELVVAGLVAAACGTTAVTVAPSVEAVSPGLPSSVAPSDTPAAATQPPATLAAATAPPATLAPPSPADTVVEDPSLLAVLPADLGGIPVVHEAPAFIDAATDRAFAQNVEAAAFAFVADGEDLASAVVARPNPGVFSDAFFRDWRDTYNEGACARAGGVVGNAESAIGELAVYIGSCAEDLLTYHTWIADRGLIVSAISLGDRRLGEQLMAGLRP